MFTSVKLWWYCRCLKSKSAEIRYAASWALGELGDARALEPILRALGDSGWSQRHGAVNGAAAEALGRLGDARAVEPLIEALDDTGPSLREAAAWSLGELRDGRAVEPLIKALREDGGWKSWGVHAAAAEALGKLGDARAVEPLIKTLVDAIGDTTRATSDLWDMNRRDLRAAAEALGKLGDARAVVPLIQALEGGGMHLPTAAAEALGKLGDGRAVVPLVAALEQGGSWASWELHVAAVEALGKLNDIRAVEPLTRELERRSSWWEVSRATANALGRLRDARAIGPLIATLGHEDGATRAACAAALREIGEAKWASLVRGDRRDVSRLAGCGDCRAVEALIKALSNNDEAVAGIAAEALGRIGDHRAVDPLVKAVVACRAGGAAARALVQLADTRAVGPLIQALVSHSPPVRSAAAKVLRQLGEPGLAALVRGRDCDLVQLACSGDPRVVEPLRRAFEARTKLGGDANWHDAASALACLGDLSMVTMLVEDLRHEWWPRRQRAALALRDVAEHRPRMIQAQWQYIAGLAQTPHVDVTTTLFNPSTGEEMTDHEDAGIGVEFPGWPSNLCD